MQIQPYLFYDGRCEEAIAYYKKALGAEVRMLMRYRDGPPAEGDAASPAANVDPDKIMHADIAIGGATLLMSDGHAQNNPRFEGFGLSLTVADTAAARASFDALAADGRTLMPLAKTFFSPSFGMVADKFGVMWMVYVAS